MGVHETSNVLLSGAFLKVIMLCGQKFHIFNICYYKRKYNKNVKNSFLNITSFSLFYKQLIKICIKRNINVNYLNTSTAMMSLCLHKVISNGPLSLNLYLNARAINKCFSIVTNQNRNFSLHNKCFHFKIFHSNIHLSL